jgi:hypothetical protein
MNVEPLRPTNWQKATTVWTGGKGGELNGPRWSVQLNGWIARLAFAMGDSSHVDDEREGRFSGPAGREHFRKGNKSSGTWPRHADENEFGARPAAADCTAPEERKAWLPCDPDAEATRATRSPSHSLDTWLIAIVAVIETTLPHLPLLPLPHTLHHIRCPSLLPPFRISLSPSGVVRGTCNLYLDISLPLSLATKSWIPHCPCP